MKFELLVHRPDAIAVLGRWYHREWGQRLRGESEREAVERISKYLNEDRIPLILVATEGDEILGAVQLKYHEMAARFPDKRYWLGGLYVRPDQRRHGIGCGLVRAAEDKARSFGVETLTLQTERPDGGLYRHCGWRPVTQAKNHNFDVLIMEKTISV